MKTGVNWIRGQRWRLREGDILIVCGTRMLTGVNGTIEQRRGPHKADISTVYSTHTRTGVHGMRLQRGRLRDRDISRVSNMPSSMGARGGNRQCDMLRMRGNCIALHISPTRCTFCRASRVERSVACAAATAMPRASSASRKRPRFRFYSLYKTQRRPARVYADVGIVAP